MKKRDQTWGFGKHQRNYYKYFCGPFFYSMIVLCMVILFFLMCSNYFIGICFGFSINFLLVNYFWSILDVLCISVTLDSESSRSLRSLIHTVKRWNLQFNIVMNKWCRNYSNNSWLFPLILCLEKTFYIIFYFIELYNFRFIEWNLLLKNSAFA